MRWLSEGEAMAGKLLLHKFCLLCLRIEWNWNILKSTSCLWFILSETIDFVFTNIEISHRMVLKQLFWHSNCLYLPSKVT